ncbi:TonB-dependent siderophore receptor [candidate division KSB1 bacterium]|nr:TonB-dependent siderophore receptor [candidate division KSB1 bacterium]NIR69149.1 TonB-dependent siderophore receptor [candidate division KSB1 bacterium]NIS25660.1 TonB-dependent siderophore receptor [candidate division KSB1 bacterium]NIT72528.1 TonB-dependent siderophore receptor [candidate division KSB1 bacterium]NIU26337.1 TonB-dependent siderophore receptor [candidate division KSB1 bacterium]
MTLLKIAKIQLYTICLCILIIPKVTFGDDGDTKTYVFADTIRVVGARYMKIPEVNSVAVKMPISIQSTPASVGIVTQALFENQDGIVLSDALKNVSGVNVQSGFGVHDFFLIRGFDSLTSGLVLTDGAAEPEVSFYNLYNINRIEVLKGPSAFLYGGNPLSGAVNLNRKQPVYTNFMNASGSYGDFQTFRGTVDAGFVIPNSNVAFRLNGLWQDSENYRDDKDNNSYAINPAVSWQLSEKGSLTANFEFVKSEFNPDSGLPLRSVGEESIQIPDVPRTQSYQSPYDNSDQELYRFRLDYRQVINESFTLRDKVYFTELDWQTNGTLLGEAKENQSSFSVPRILQLLDDDQKFLGNQLEAIFSFNTGAVGHNLLTGFEIARNTDDFDLRTTNLDTVDLFAPQIPEQGPPLESVPKLPFAIADARSLIFAPYLVNQTMFSDKFKLFYGARFDVIDYDDERTDFLQFENRIPIFDDSETERNYQQLNPMFGAVLSPTQRLSFYINAGQSFAPPSTLVSGDRQPEESTQFEVGTKTNLLDGKLTSTLAFYHLEKENIGIPDETGIIRESGDQRSRGFEFELNARPATGWYTFFTYAFTDAELTEFRAFNNTGGIDDHSGNNPPFAPEHILSLWTTREFKNGFGIGGGVRYVSSQFVSPNNQFEIDDYLTFDAVVSYSFRNLKWSINVKNITDQDYETRSGQGSNSVIPANPFAIYGGFDFSL